MTKGITSCKNDNKSNICSNSTSYQFSYTKHVSNFNLPVNLVKFILDCERNPVGEPITDEQYTNVLNILSTDCSRATQKKKVCAVLGLQKPLRRPRKRRSRKENCYWEMICNDLKMISCYQPYQATLQYNFDHFYCN